jgi:excisionase family DNA binding protein
MRTTDPDRLCQLEEVAEHLVVNVETVRRYIREGKIPAVRLGGGESGEYRVRWSDLYRLLYASDGWETRGRR